MFSTGSLVYTNSKKDCDLREIVWDTVGHCGHTGVHLIIWEKPGAWQSWGKERNWHKWTLWLTSVHRLPPSTRYYFSSNCLVHLSVGTNSVCTGAAPFALGEGTFTGPTEASSLRVSQSSEDFCHSPWLGRWPTAGSWCKWQFCHSFQQDQILHS